jgi:succinyl-diaminopimelate desuccinylase
VGSDEESDNKDFVTYLKTHSPPDVTLVLDSLFPVVVGEKAWNALELTVADPYRSREAARAPWTLVELDAGVAASIVPPRAVARLRWSDLTGFDAALEALCPTVMPDGFDCDAAGTADDAVLTVTGRAAHSGMNLEGGRNALVFLADALHGKVKPCGAADLLDFAAMAGKDTRGGGLGLDREDPLWGSYGVNVAMLKPLERGKLRLTINLRRIPPMTNDQIRSHLAARVSKYSDERRTAIETGGFFDDEPFAVPPEARLVRRLLAAYERSTGEEARPAITGGGTYAKRLPNAIAFGMWFPGQPYSGHDVDERIAIADLHRGVAVLLEALNDLAYSAPIAEPLQP